MPERPAGPERPAQLACVMALASIRSRKVRRILALEARARRLLTRYERALDRAVRTKSEVHRLLDQAHVIEGTLAGRHLGELRAGRAERGPRPAHPSATLSGGVSVASDRPTTPQ